MSGYHAVINFETPISELNIQDGVLIIRSTKKMPNFFWRFWQYSLLGFKWKKI